MPGFAALAASIVAAVIHTPLSIHSRSKPPAAAALRTPRLTAGLWCPSPSTPARYSQLSARWSRLMRRGKASANVTACPRRRKASQRCSEVVPGAGSPR